MLDYLRVDKTIQVRSGDYRQEWKDAKIVSVSLSTCGMDCEGNAVIRLSFAVRFLESGTAQYIADAFGCSKTDWRYKKEI